MNTRYVFTLCTAVVIGGVLIAGSAQAVSKTDEKTAMNDSWITAKTKIAPAANHPTRASRRELSFYLANQLALILRRQVSPS